MRIAGTQVEELRQEAHKLLTDAAGILTNEDHIVAQEVKEEGLDQPTFVEYQDTAFSSNISTIGSYWK